VVSVLTVHPPISQTHSLRISRQPFPVPRARLLECGTTRPAHGVAWRRVVSPHCFAGALTTAAASPSIDSVGWGVKPRAAHAPYVPASLLPAGCRLDAFVTRGPAGHPSLSPRRAARLGSLSIGVRGWSAVRVRACGWRPWAWGNAARTAHLLSARLGSPPRQAFSLCCVSDSPYP
jgi:hypothetical protein